MVQARDKIAAALVVAAMVTFGVVVAPTAIDPMAAASDAVDASAVSTTQNVVAEDYSVRTAIDAVIDNGDGTETVEASGDDAVSKMTDEGTDGLGDSIEIVVAPAGTY